MGCTSSKKIKKHTSSIEDVSQQKDAPPLQQTNDVKSQSKNGQAGGKQTNAIQIPGANKSFLAPDGIPFIDEDVEEDADESINAAVSSSDVKVEAHASITPTATGPTGTVTTNLKSSALENGGNGGETRTTTHLVDTSEPRPDVIGQILAEESKISKHRADTDQSGDARIEITNNNTSPQEDVAAAKIQAGVRGYLDRKKVKALREQQNGFDEHHEGGGGDRQIITDKSMVKVEYSNSSSTDPEEQRLNNAATRIQANYKGYKTRKELKK